MDSLSQLKKSMDEMAVLFETRMTTFEETLSHGDAQDASALSKDFHTFKNLIWKAVTGLKIQLELVHNTLDGIEMRSRSSTLLLHGVPEAMDENPNTYAVELCRNTLNIKDVPMHPFSTCVRLGRDGNSSRPRPMLLRFQNQHIRDQVWQAKKLLKGSGLTLSEFLTSNRHAVFVEARKILGVKGCWTANGRIVVVCPDGSRRKIVSMAEFRSFKSDYVDNRGNQKSLRQPPGQTETAIPVEIPVKPPNKTMRATRQQRLK